jgi:hypothetical protein
MQTINTRTEKESTVYRTHKHVVFVFVWKDRTENMHMLFSCCLRNIVWIGLYFRVPLFVLVCALIFSSTIFLLTTLLRMI